MGTHMPTHLDLLPISFHSKELWPVMDKWIKNRKGRGNASSPSDVITAMVLRLIGEYLALKNPLCRYQVVENPALGFLLGR